MKKQFKIAIALILSMMVMFAFAGCGGSGSSPTDEAKASLDTTLSALKSADMNAIEALGGGEDSLEDAVESLGSEEGTQSVLQSMFGHFDYTLGEAEQVDDTHINIQATVSNADMEKAVQTWFSELMSYAISNPDIANDEDALRDKTIEMLATSVEKVAGEEGGIVTNEVEFPMVLEDGKWEIADSIDDSVMDKMLGGFITAVSKLQQNGQ